MQRAVSVLRRKILNKFYNYALKSEIVDFFVDLLLIKSTIIRQKMKNLRFTFKNKRF